MGGYGQHQQQQFAPQGGQQRPGQHPSGGGAYPPVRGAGGASGDVSGPELALRSAACAGRRSRPKPKRRGLALVAATALLVGTAGGVGGAAVYSATNDSGGNSPSVTAPLNGNQAAPAVGAGRLGAERRREGAAERGEDRGRDLAGCGDRLGHRDQQGRPDRHQQPRGGGRRQRRQHLGDPERRPDGLGHRQGHRPAHRPRGDQGGRERPDPGHARQQRQARASGRAWSRSARRSAWRRP